MLKTADIFEAPVKISGCRFSLGTDVNRKQANVFSRLFSCSRRLSAIATR